ncbi:MAG: hypothetical protein R3F34_21045, partial [Planctomycetota bacterium]
MHDDLVRGHESNRELDARLTAIEVEFRQSPTLDGEVARDGVREADVEGTDRIATRGRTPDRDPVESDVGEVVAFFVGLGIVGVRSCCDQMHPSIAQCAAEETRIAFAVDVEHGVEENGPVDPGSERPEVPHLARFQADVVARERERAVGLRPRALDAVAALVEAVGREGPELV